jgi:GNAT superfamily N-acetyltransferase
VRCPGRPGREFLTDGFGAMPRYFFNTRIGDELIADPDGEELRDPDRAWEIARLMIPELLRTEGAGGALIQAVLEVTDDEGEIVLEFPFTEALLDPREDPPTTH